MALTGRRETTRAPHRAPEDGRRDAGDEQPCIDLDESDEDERLRDGRQRMTDIQCAGKLLSPVRRKNFTSAVVGANDPMPSVSKKFVTDPTATAAGFVAGRIAWPPA